MTILQEMRFESWITDVQPGTLVEISKVNFDPNTEYLSMMLKELNEFGNGRIWEVTCSSVAAFSVRSRVLLGQDVYAPMKDFGVTLKCHSSPILVQAAKLNPMIAEPYLDEIHYVVVGATHVVDIVSSNGPVVVAKSK